MDRIIPRRLQRPLLQLMVFGISVGCITEIIITYLLDLFEKASLERLEDGIVYKVYMIVLVILDELV